MRWLDRLRQRLAGHARPRRGNAGEDSSGAAFAIIDTETTGLDVTRDRLLSIGAVGVTGARIDPADSFYAVLQQDAPSRSADILIHRVGTGEQAAGDDPGAALDAFSAWCGSRWAVAFHAGFDRRMLERAYRAQRRPPPALAGWIDLAVLAPLLFPERAVTASSAGSPVVSLDDWLAAFGIDEGDRHNALGDALSTAHLLLPVLARAGTRGLADPAALARESAAAESLRAMRG